jgi:D-sedoheptulose 7-phosphate isomerase
MNRSQEVEVYIREGAGLLERTAGLLGPALAETAGVLARVIRTGGKVLLCGNGGSAALAQHVACELIGRMRGDHPSWPAIALSSDSSVLTAVANDFGFDAVFSRQVRAYGSPGDVLVAISTSGSSPNVLAAAREARDMRMVVVGLTGRDGGPLAELCTHLLAVPSHDTPRVQEVQGVLAHAICMLVQGELAGD